MIGTAPPRFARFGAFEVDLRAGELRKNGMRIKLQEKPFHILALLLEHPGEPVLRDELCKKLWPSATFVDFDHSLGTAIGKLRQALGDSAQNPRFVETLSSRGYRFIAPVTNLPQSPDAGSQGSTTESRVGRISPPGAGVLSTLPQRRRWVQGIAALCLLGLGIAWFGWRRPPSQSHPAGIGSIRSLAVLPLENLSSNKQQEYFVDGMTDELITELAKIGSLRVISRTSVMSYKGARKPLPQIARELNVDAVIEGGVLRSGNRVRVTAQLVRAATDQHLWAETYERDLRDVMGVQDEVVQAIAHEVRVRLTPGEQNHLAARRPVNSEAFDDYLKGRYHLNRGTEEEIGKGIEHFQRAVEKDPGFALAYAGLANSYVAYTDFYLPPSETMPKARAAAIRALELDDTLSESHTSLGVVRLLFDWDWIGAEKEFKRAIELDSNSTDAHVWYANFLTQMGRPQEAIPEIGRAGQLDPLSLNVCLNAGWVFYLARRDDQAVQALRNAMDLEPNFPLTHSCIWLAYGPKAELAKAIESWEKSGLLKRSSPIPLAIAAGFYAESGKQTEARKILAKLKGMSKQRYVCPYEMGASYTALGENDEALSYLEEAYQQRSICLPDLKTDPRFDSLRADPHFQDLLHRVGF